MRTHTQNLFKVNNLSNLDFSYKLVEVDLPKIDDKILYNTALQKVAYKISSKINGPSAIISRDNKHWIAIPSNRNFPELKIRTNPFTVISKLIDTTCGIDWEKMDKNSFEIIYKFLDFEIRKQVKENFGLWETNSYQFFLKKPIIENTETNIDIFGGFKYRLIYQSDGHFYVALDLAYKYLDRYYLPYYVNLGNQNNQSKSLKGRKCLYQNGDQWYSVEIVGFGKKISEHLVPFDCDTPIVQDYIKSKTKYNKFKTVDLMSPDHLALLYKYPGRAMEPHHGATSLAKLIYNTNDTEVKSLHKYSIKPPDKKFEYIIKNIKQYFQSLTYNKVAFQVTNKPESDKENYFNVPALKGNSGKTLLVGNNKDNGNITLRDYGAMRKRLITDNGILNQDGFDNQYLIVPSNLDRGIVDAFKKHALSYLKKLAPRFTDLKVITYDAKPQLAATLQVSELDKKLREYDALDGFALFILPDLNKSSNRAAKNFHDCLKNKFFPELKFQCASATKVKSFYGSYANKDKGYEIRLHQDKEHSFRSYLFNLVNEFLLVNRKWPYALLNKLHYDIYIGIDVHERYAGFTFFYKNGEHIIFDYERVPKKTSTNRSEKLRKDLIINKILPKLELHIPNYAPNPNGIVIVRDGRSYGEEEIALDEVIDKLADKNLVEKDTIKRGVIDLHKQSAIPLRIGSETSGYNKLENPRAGSYKFINPANEGFLFNTGYPFEIRGTAKPLHLIKQSGDLDFKLVMEDLFAQTMLAFSAPDRSNSLPIIIKLIDTFLEPLAAAFEDEEINEDDMEEEIEKLITN